MKITNSPGIYKTMHRNRNCLLLFGKNNKDLQFHMNHSSYFEISVSFYYTPSSNKDRTLKILN